MKTIRIVVSGKVQGVYFRQSTKEMAQQLGITGTVKNLSNGSVEVIATGIGQQLQLLADWCHQGPPRARVDDVQTSLLPYEQFTDFKVTR